MMKSIRPAIVFAALSAVLAGCTEIPLEPAGSSAQFDSRSGETSNHVVRVLVTGPLPVPGVLVTATNTQTGAYTLAFTTEGGVATFNLTNGSYLLHARNLSDAGPVVPGLGELRLAIAPLPEGQRLLNTAATQGANHVSALYTPNGSVPMTPQNYSALSQQPPLVLSGPGTTHDLTISFLAGATVTCNLIDAAANAVPLPAAENMFVILPVDPSLPMPPVPQVLQDLNLPRGLLTTATTVAAGSNSCSVAGIMATPPGGVVIETNSVTLNGEEKVFISTVEVSGVQAARGATIRTVMIAEPRRGLTHYIPDPFGDSPVTTDIGLVTGGWVFHNGLLSDEFVLAARFRGLGEYVLQISYNDGNGAQTHQIRAICREGGRGCTFNDDGSTLPQGLLIAVEGASAFIENKVTGNIIWRLNLPGVTEVDVRVFTGQPGQQDSAPNGLQPARMKKAGNGNTWIIPS